MMTFLFLTRVNFSSDIKPFPHAYWELPPLNNDVKSHDSKSKVKVRKHLSTEGCWYHLLKMNIFCAIFVVQFCYTNGAKPNFILMLMDDVSKFGWHFIFKANVIPWFILLCSQFTIVFSCLLYSLLSLFLCHLLFSCLYEQMKLYLHL